MNCSTNNKQREAKRLTNLTYKKKKIFKNDFLSTDIKFSRLFFMSFPSTFINKNYIPTKKKITFFFSIHRKMHQFIAHRV